jgi:hypothetical protein
MTTNARTASTSAIRFLGVMLVFYAGLVTALLLSEVVRVGVLGFFDPSIRSIHNFGGDAAVGHGGWVYLTWQIYVLSIFVEGSVYVFAATYGVFAWREKSWKRIGTTLILLVVVTLWQQWRPGSVE